MHRSPPTIARTPKIATSAEIAPPKRSIPAGFWNDTAADSEAFIATGLTMPKRALPTVPITTAQSTTRHLGPGTVPVGNSSKRSAAAPAVNNQVQKLTNVTHCQAGNAIVPVAAAMPYCSVTIEIARPPPTPRSAHPTAFPRRRTMSAPIGPNATPAARQDAIVKGSPTWSFAIRARTIAANDRTAIAALSTSGSRPPTEPPPSIG